MVDKNYFFLFSQFIIYPDSNFLLSYFFRITRQTLFARFSHVHNNSSLHSRVTPFQCNFHNGIRNVCGIHSLLRGSTWRTE